jgi:hypothetical protein
LCEDVEQVNQIKSYDEFELIKFAKFYAFHSAKQSALLNLEDINNVEKLLHYKIRDKSTSKKSNAAVKTLASLCAKFKIANPGNDKTKLVQVCSHEKY